MQESNKEYWDYYSTMTTSYNKGKAEGRAEGLAEGKDEANRENARKLKELGVSPRYYRSGDWLDCGRDRRSVNPTINRF